MPPDLRPLKSAIITYGHTEAYKRGQVQVQGAQIAEVRVSPYKAHLLMCRTDELDIAEISIGTYLSAVAVGLPFTAIPVFPYRRFQHAAILYNVNSGIRHPKDLEGKRVGIRRYYTLTAAFWARGILTDDYGVDLDKINWVVHGDEIVEAFTPPANVTMAPPGEDLRAALIAGELDAAVSVTPIGNRGVDSPDVRLLIPNPQEAEVAWFQKTGIFPIDHLVVIKNKLLEEAPWVADELYRTLEESKNRYFQMLGDGPPRWSEDETMLWFKRFMGPDPMGHGVTKNRKTLEAAMRYAVEQRILPKAMPVEDLFAKTAASATW